MNAMPEQGCFIKMWFSIAGDKRDMGRRKSLSYNDKGSIKSVSTMLFFFPELLFNKLFCILGFF